MDCSEVWNKSLRLPTHLSFLELPAASLVPPMNITYVLKDVFFALKYAYVMIKYFGMFLFGVLALLKVPHNHYVQFSQFYWHFEILNRKTGY